MARNHEYQPGPTPPGIKEYSKGSRLCVRCGGGEDAYQHQDDNPQEHKAVRAGDIGDTVEAQ